MSLYRRKDSKVWWMSLKADDKRLRTSTDTENKKLAKEIHAVRDVSGCQDTDKASKIAFGSV